MMTKLLTDLQGVVQNEYTRAGEQHGYIFNGLHEAYAITLEEVDEASAEMQGVYNRMTALWESVKRDNGQLARQAALDILNKAMLMAAEAVQIAAMAQKTVNTIDMMVIQNEPEKPVQRLRRSERRRLRI